MIQITFEEKEQLTELNDIHGRNWKRILEIVRKLNLQCISVGFEKILQSVENEKSIFRVKQHRSKYATIDWIECIE